MELFTLFPQLLAKVQVENHAQYKEVLVPALTEQYEKNPYEKLDWARWADTWNMNANLTNDLGFQKYINAWLEYFKYPLVEYEIRAWFNVHKWYNFQESHTHFGNDCFLSGIYYIQLDEKDRAAEFVRDSDHEYIYTLNLFNGKAPEHPYYTKYSTDAGLNVEEGDLLLFTPDMKHFVPQAKEKHDGLRMSLSFNVHKKK